MNLNRVIGSIPLLILTGLTIPWAIYGAAMSAFGPKPYDPNAPRNAIIALIVFLVIPALAIWVPARAALGLGGIILAVPALLSMLFLWLIPPAGIIALIPIALW